MHSASLSRFPAPAGLRLTMENVSPRKSIRSFTPCGILAIVGICISCAPRPAAHERHLFFRMDMPTEVTIVNNGRHGNLAPVWRAIDSLLAEWENRYSQTRPASEVLAINRRDKPCVPVSPVLGRMISRAIQFGDSTHGMFDITILPLKHLWGLGEGDTMHRVPSEDSLAAARSRVDYRKVALNPDLDTVCMASPETQIDAGGFAKGYALIEISRLLHDRGFGDFLISSGDILASGKRGDGNPWRIGIQHPRREQGKLLATVTLDSGAIFTSGDYERFWIAPDGRRVHHIFNPMTGRSCTRNQSVTIWGMDPIAAKMLSTGLFCLPADSIVSYVSTRSMECVVVDSIGSITISPGWQHAIKLTQNE